MGARQWPCGNAQTTVSGQECWRLACESCRPVKERLVAYQGKLVTVVEQLGGAVPNGSGFVITTAPAPALDYTNLVVGHVTQGFDVVQQIAALPVVKPNRGSPFLKVRGAGALVSAAYMCRDDSLFRACCGHALH